MNDDGTTKYQVSRRITRVEYGTMEAESHAQAADMLRTGMWCDVVTLVRDSEAIEYEVNGLPLWCRAAP